MKKTKAAMRLRRIAVVLALGLAAAIVPAAPALAVSCWGSNCTGVDPQASGCSSASVSTLIYYPLVNHNSQTTTAMELRYSAVCGAMWGRYTSDLNDDYCCWYTQLYIERQIYTYYGWAPPYRYSVTIPPGAGTYWTAMMDSSAYGNDRHRLCHKYLGDPDSSARCTYWYV